MPFTTDNGEGCSLVVWTGCRCGTKFICFSDTTDMTVTVRSPAATSTGFFTERTEFDDSKKKRTESAGDKNLHTKSSPGKPLILACI